MKDYIAAIRPKQWVKNIFVFTAVFFGFRLDVDLWAKSLMAFVAFAALSSGFYLINDILDKDDDKLHPTKRLRPIAADKVPVPVAWGIATAFLFGTLITIFFINNHLGFVLLAYAGLQVSYNWFLKKMPLLDILAIAAGFALRALAGSAATDVPLSNWFLLCIAMLSLFIAIEKRKTEFLFFQKNTTNTRKVLQQYSMALLDKIETITITALLIAYMLWCSGPKLQGAPTPWLMLTLPIVFYGVFRYFMLSDPSTPTALTAEKPEDILFADKPIFLAVLIWILTTFGILFAYHEQLIS